MGTSSIILFLVGIFFLFYVTYNKCHNVFHPILLFLLFYLSRNLLTILTMLFSGESFFNKPYFTYPIEVQEILYFSLMFISFCSLIYAFNFGYKSHEIIINSDIDFLEFKTIKIIMRCSLVIAIVGIGGYALSCGSLLAIINNFVRRGEITSENWGVRLALIFGPLFMYCGTFFLGKNQMSVRRYFIYICMMCVMLMVTGSRRTALSPLIGCAIIYAYLCPQFGRLKNLWKYMILGFLFFPLLIIVSDLRQRGRPELLVNNTGKYFATLTKGNKQTSGFVSEQLSNISITMFIIDFYSGNKYWCGKSFYDLCLAPIPSKLYSEKPPVDDGVYVYTAAKTGINYEPSTSRNILKKSSWPPETFGLGYINFGFLGAIAFMGLYGYIVGLVLKYAQARFSALLFLVLMYKLIFTFALTVQGLFNFITEMGLYVIFYYLVRSIVKRRYV